MRSVVLVLLLFGINGGYALHCYNCNSQTIDGCKIGSPQLNETTCGLEHPDFKTFCILKVVYDKQLEKDNVLSGCEITGKSTEVNKNISQCQTDSRYQVKDCVACDSDLCNFSSSGTSIRFSVFYYITAVFVIIKTASRELR